MADSFVDTQSYLVEEPGRSLGSTSTTSVSNINSIPGNDNIPQKRRYTTSIFDVDSLSRYPGNARSGYSQNRNNDTNNVFDETSPIPAPDGFGNPSPFTNSTDVLSSPYQFSLDAWWDSPLSYQQQSEEEEQQQHQPPQQLLLSFLSDSDVDGDEEASTDITSNKNNNNNTSSNSNKDDTNGIFSFVLDKSRTLPVESRPVDNELHQDDSSFTESIRISDFEDSDTEHTQSPLSPSGVEHTPTRLNLIPTHQQQQQQQQEQLSEQINSSQRTTTKTQPLYNSYDEDDDSSAMWDNFPDIADMVLPGDLDSDATAPYDMNEYPEPTNAIRPNDMDELAGLALPHDMVKPAETLDDEDDSSVATVPYDVDGYPVPPVDDDRKNSLVTAPYDVDDSCEVHAVDHEDSNNKSVVASYNEDRPDESDVDIASDTSSIYDLDDSGGFDFGFNDGFNNDNCGGSPSYDDNCIEQPCFDDPKDLNGITLTSHDSSLLGDSYVLDSQPDSSYVIDEGYHPVECSSDSVSKKVSMTSPHRTHTDSGSSQSLSQSPQYKAMERYLVFHDSSNQSHHHDHDQKQRQHDTPISTDAATMGLAFLGKGTKSGSDNHSQQKKCQQTSIEAFYSQLSMVSSLSTAKSFSDSDNQSSGLPKRNSTPPQRPTSISQSATKQELVVSCSPPRKNPALASLDQLRVAKIKKRSTLSPKKDEQWMPVSRNLSSLSSSSSSSPPLQQQQRISQSMLSDLMVEEQKQQQGNNTVEKTADTLPPTPPSDQLKCRPQRRWMIGLSKPKNASSLVSTSSTPSIASMLGREHSTNDHNNTLQLTNTITKSSTVKSILPRKKALGMLRQRANVHK